MSSFVAIFQRDGAAADAALLHRLTRTLPNFYGQHGVSECHSGPVGFGHVPLREPKGSSREGGIESLDGRYRIVADVRLDCRVALRDQLAAADCRVEEAASDATLVLHAYSMWGRECVSRLRGDFSFAIWDALERALFCARDHFGIKPFYYARGAELFVCSNVLDCVRLHPGISGELNDQAVADFLLSGLNWNRATTIFRDIQRLLPAHTLSISGDRSQVARYWSAPTDGWIRYRRPDEYAEHFREVIDVAVSERLDSECTGIFLSGGLDSGTLAATAADDVGKSNVAERLRAYTTSCERLLGVTEEPFARATAEHLGIPIRFLPFDDVRPFEGWDDLHFALPEPINDPLFGMIHGQFRAVAEDTSVVFNGEGLDNLMYFQLAPYLKFLARRGEWLPLLTASAGYLWTKRSRWHRLGARAIRRFCGSRKSPGLPPWIATDFARRISNEGLLSSHTLPAVSPANLIHPKGHASLEFPHWTRMFEMNAPAVTRQPVEVRYPFLDLRVVEYVLSLPPYPFCLDKQLARAAMNGKLPAQILSRPKTPLAVDPAAEALRIEDRDWKEVLDWTGEIAQYIDSKSLPSKENMGRGTLELPTHIHTFCFNFWLRSARGVRYNELTEVRK